MAPNAQQTPPGSRPQTNAHAKLPRKKWRVIHGIHTQGDPRYDHFDFTAPAGHPDSPFLADEFAKETGARMIRPKQPIGSEESPFVGDLVNGFTRKVVTYYSLDYRQKEAERFKLPPPPPNYDGDVFESPYDMSRLDREKFAPVSDPYADETKEDRLVRLKRELAELEAEMAAAEKVFAPDTIDGMTLEELKKYAAENKIEVGKNATREQILKQVRQLVPA